MKIKDLKINLFGLELKISMAAATKASEKNPGQLVVQKISDFLTPEIKPEKIKSIRDI